MTATPLMLCGRDRERLLSRLAELRAIDRLVREAGRNRPPDPPPPLAARKPPAEAPG